MDPQVAMSGQGAADRFGQGADAHLQAGAVLDQAGDDPADDGVFRG